MLIIIETQRHEVTEFNFLFFNNITLCLCVSVFKSKFYLEAIIFLMAMTRRSISSFVL